jgi:UDP-3-O-[3-hydroxymyristoyl] glucosamine N-acyltransferase
VGLALTEGPGIGEGVGVGMGDGVGKGVVLGGVVGVKVGVGVGEGVEVGDEVGVGVGSGLFDSSQPNRKNPTRRREAARKRLVRFRPILMVSRHLKGREKSGISHVPVHRDFIEPLEP